MNSLYQNNTGQTDALKKLLEMLRDTGFQSLTGILASLANGGSAGNQSLSSLLGSLTANGGGFSGGNSGTSQPNSGTMNPASGTSQLTP